jgi:hypothetical protein
VGRAVSLFFLVLSPDWFILVLLYHISHQVPGVTETETPIPAEVSEVGPDLTGILYLAVQKM